AIPSMGRLAVAGLIAFVVSVGIARATAGPGLIGVVATVATVAGAAWLGWQASARSAASGSRAWALRLMQWSFVALGMRSVVNVAVMGTAYLTASRPEFTLPITLTQAFLLVMAAALQLVAVLDEERARGIQQVEQLRQAELAVSSSRRLESLGRMAGIVAHDFNNVLSVISMSAESALDTGSGDTGDDLREISASAKRGQALTSQLLAFARQEPQQVTRFDANVQLDKLRGLLQRIVGKQATLSVSGAGPPLLVEMDSTQFDQVVMNLVVNARDATPPGGTITVQLADSAAQ